MQQPPEHDDLPLKNMVAAALQCGSSNVFVMPIEGTDFSLNKIISGINHMHNHAGINMNNYNPFAGESGSGCGNGGGGWSRNGSGADQNASSQREAALNKFRQKRKERNFEKKVMAFMILVYV